jgi:hypothetical protein
MSKISGLKKEKRREDRKNNIVRLYSTQVIIRVIKSSRMK